jgi:hypothetical protein
MSESNKRNAFASREVDIVAELDAGREMPHVV